MTEIPLELAAGAIEGVGAGAAATAGVAETAGTALEAPEALAGGLDVAAPDIAVPEGVAAVDDGAELTAAAEDDGFGDLGEGSEPVVDVDAAEPNDSDLFDEAEAADGPQPDKVGKARHQVDEVFEEEDAEADTDGADSNVPGGTRPPTGRNGNRGGDEVGGDPDPADGAAEGDEEEEVVDAELVDSEEADMVPDDGRAEADIVEADVVEADPADEADPDAEPHPADEHEADPADEADPEDEKDPEAEDPAPEDVDNPDDEHDPADDDKDVDEADPDAEPHPADEHEADPADEADPEDEKDPEAEDPVPEDVDNPDDEHDPADDDKDVDEADPDSKEDPDAKADPDAEDPDFDEREDPDRDTTPEGIPELEDEFNRGLDELHGLVQQREQIAADNPFSDELTAVNDSINAVNERLLGVQNQMQGLRYAEDLQELDRYLQERDAPDTTPDMQGYYDDVIDELRDEIGNLSESLDNYAEQHGGAPEFGPGRDHSVIPQELLGLHPRELHQVRDAVEGKLNELYPDRADSPDKWTEVGAQPFEEYMGHIDTLLAQREAYLGTMNSVERAAYLARETAAGLGRAAYQGAMGRLHDRTTGNLDILQDRIGEMHPVHRPDHAAADAQRVLDQSTQRRATLRATGGVFRQVRGAVGDYTRSRGLNENGRAVRLMQAQTRMAERRAQMLRADPAAAERIGDISVEQAIRHQTRGGGTGTRQSGGGNRGSEDRAAPRHDNRAVRAVRAAQHQYQVRKEHNAHKAHRQELERKIEKIRKEHPVHYFLSPILQVVGLHHKELAAHQSQLNVARSNELRTSIPGQLGGAILNGIAG